MKTLPKLCPTPDDARKLLHQQREAANVATGTFSRSYGIAKNAGLDFAELVIGWWEASDEHRCLQIRQAHEELSEGPMNTSEENEYEPLRIG